MHSVVPKFFAAVIVAAIVLAQPHLAAAQRPCTEADYAGEYTECRNGLHNAVWYKKPGVICAGGAQQPENSFGIPCDIACSPGEFLAFGSPNALGCTKCSPGTYSVGGGTRISVSDWNANTPWSQFGPAGVVSFRTWCVDVRNKDAVLPIETCPGWNMVNGAFAESGNKTEDNQQSILEMSVRLVRDGSITFEYTVDAEQNYDMLSFEVDNYVMLDRISHQLEPARFSAQLSSGVHTLRWKFTKDFSVSEGRDEAFLRMIEVSGTAYADSTCYPCPVGTYSGGLGASQCSLCEANTFSTVEGASSCTACPATEFSYPGSTSCQPRSPCHESDWVTVFTPCVAGHRNQYFTWLSPKICDDSSPDADPKPADNLNIDCSFCNPGTRRNSEGVCEACPANTYSAGGNSICQTCSSGSVGRRDFIWQNFEELPYNVSYSTSCDGACGSNGWRLVGSHLDSGSGHGAFVDVQFTIPVTVVVPGLVNFNFSFSCTRSCHLSFVDEIVSEDGDRRVARSRSFYSYWSDDGLVSYTTEPGMHEFTWYFSQYDPMLASRNDKILIHSINITGVEEGQGGASQCVACPPGTKADPLAAVCRPCPPGTTSGPRSSTCTPCASNTFAESAGSPQCEPCGAGTSSPAGAASCTATCIFSPRPGLTFDLNPLRRNTTAYGPLRDIQSRDFFFNICEKQLGTTCRDEDGLMVQSYACHLEHSRGADGGHFMAMSMDEDESAVKVKYSRGTVGCGYGYWGTGGRPRETEIRMVCDPDAGVGIPILSTPFESPRCSFHFEWRSLYACPICTKDDMDFYYTDCIDGSRDKIYFWKDNPKKCHSGLPLPKTVSQNCTSDELTVCPAGTRKVDTCISCDSGSYSLGGGLMIQNWNAFPDSMRTFCNSPAGCAMPWTPKSRFALSGSPGSVLQLIVNFVRPGTFSFSYSAVLARSEFLRFSVDGVARDFRRSALKSTTIDISISQPGSHVFLWEFRRNTSSDAFAGSVKLHSVTVVGTRFHDLSCTQCPAGFYQPSSNASSCIPCPENTFADVVGREQCVACPATQWAPRASSRCFSRPLCTVADYTAVYSSCKNGMRTKTYRLRQPSICREGAAPPAENVACTCPSGARPSADGSCRTCSDGEYIPAGSDVCRRAERGKFARRIQSLVESQPEQTSLPAGASTNCTGLCLSPWVLSSAGLESGVQVGDSNSYLTVPVEIASVGASVTLEFSFTGPSATTLQILLDGNIVAQHFSAKRRAATIETSIPLQKGRHYISLNFLNPPTYVEGAGRSYVVVSKFNIVGSTIGSAEAVPCSEGTYSAADGASSCAECPPGTFAPVSGMASCTPCPISTFSNDIGAYSCFQCGEGSFTESTSSTKCLTSSVYPMSNSSFFDLRRLTERAVSDIRFGREYIINVSGNVSRLGCDSYACMRTADSDAFVDMGRNPDFIAPAPEANQWLLSFADGSLCINGKRTRLNIRFKCDMSNPLNLGEPRLTDSDECSATFEWITPAACTACSQSDFSPVYGKCQAGVQKITYVAPSSCYNSGFEQPATEERQCNDVEFPLFAVVVALLTFVALVVVLVVVWIKNRRLYAEYSLLKDAHMDQLDSHLETSTTLDVELEEDNRL